MKFDRHFYSHAQKLDGKKVGSKLLFVHTIGVKNKALGQLYSQVAFGKKGLDISNFLGRICDLHDLGKYTDFFQDYLLGLPHDKNLKQHARFGAFVAWNIFQEHIELAYIAYYLIKNHHRNLHTPDQIQGDGFLDGEEMSYKTVFDAQEADLRSKIAQIEFELSLPKLNDFLSLPEAKQLRRFLKKWVNDNAEIQNYFLINYLFSLLIEGDKLDASDTHLYARKKIPHSAVVEYLRSLPSEDNLQNRLRNTVREEVLAKLSEPDILEKKLFLLTAPTGIGKTLTALDFALRLREKLDYSPQIIVGLPFINIIEQTLNVYQEVLSPYSVKVLAHYQYADVFGSSEKKEEEEEEKYNRKRMELDTWQSDVVITSFVQLLQTMISNRNKLLLKFNHFAGAIVIMDEVQSIRLEQVPLVGAVLYFMSKFLNTRFLLMTATKPLIFELAEREILSPKYQISILPQVKHLLKDPKEIFLQFSRTKIVPLLDQKLENADDFLAVFAREWSSSKACLIVCNTVNRSIEVFEKINKFFSEKEYPNSLYYLSTNVIPAHRLGIIKQIKEDLKSEKKPVLVSTQVVEAGVDLDFDMGFRDLGPVDSIVQVAGRINRENSPERENSPLYVIDFGDCQRIYGAITDAQARKALGNVPIPEPAYFDLVDQYFWNIAGKEAYLYSRKLFNGIHHLYYDGDEKEDRIPIFKFKVIEGSPFTTSVFIEWDEKAEASRIAFVSLLNAPNRDVGLKLKEEFEKNYKKTFHQHIIAVPKYYTEGLPLIDENHPDVSILVVSQKLLSDWYRQPVGFNRQRSAQELREINLATQL